MTEIDGTILHSKVEPYPFSKLYSYENMVRDVTTIALSVLEESGIPKKKVLGLGVGLPGPVNRKKGILYSAGSFDWGENKKAAADLARETGLFVIIENNARVRAIGEEMRSSSTSSSMFAYLLVARGVVCPIIFNSDVLTGDLTGAGEISHVLVGEHERICPECGNKGCLNEIGSHHSILRRAEDIQRNNKESRIYKPGASENSLKMEDVLAAQHSGDAAVDTILTEAATGIAMAVSYSVESRIGY